MRKIILASHGTLAKGMQCALELITGDNDNVFSYGMEPGIHPDYIKNEIQALIDQDVNKENEYVIITDLLGGSVNNSLMSFYSQGNVQIVTGMNLSLVIQITQGDENEKLEDLITAGIESARNGITSINSILASKSEKKGGEDNLW